MRSEDFEDFAAGFWRHYLSGTRLPGLGNEQLGYQAPRARSLASLGCFALPPCWFPFIRPPFVVELQNAEPHLSVGLPHTCRMYHRYPILRTHPFYIGGPCLRVLSGCWLIRIKTVILARDRDSGVSLRNNSSTRRTRSESSTGTCLTEALWMYMVLMEVTFVVYWLPLDDSTGTAPPSPRESLPHRDMTQLCTSCVFQWRWTSVRLMMPSSRLRLCPQLLVVWSGPRLQESRPV